MALITTSGCWEVMVKSCCHQNYIFNKVNHLLRRVHTMKVMRIGSELIHIVCVHTECALTAIRIECALGQSTSIGGLKPD